MIKILGISAYYHDSAAALLIDGKIISACQEERFTRKKHDSSFPEKAIRNILEINNLTIDDIDYVVFYEKPFLKFERLLQTYLSTAPRGFTSFKTAIPLWLRDKLFQKSIISKELKKFSNNFDIKKLFFSEHHLSHAASAFYPSPYDDAVILTLDGVGEWATTTVCYGRHNKITIDKEINFPHSIGLLYAAFTYYLGFKINSGEYKVMGLAPYGTPKYKNLILSKIVNLKEDGTFRLNQKYFNYMTGLTMTSPKFSELFGHPVRQAESETLTQFHMDVAASIQAVTEEIVLRLTKSLSKQYKTKNLCLAGGVALNCVANGKIKMSKYFKNIFIQPAAGDAGGSLGAALTLWHNELGNNRIVEKPDSMNGCYLGPEFSNEQVELALKNCGAIFENLDYDNIIKSTAKSLKNNDAIGWFQGKMEFGPRALGSRSIIANPMSEDMQKKLNMKVKFRESFRPFAPSILDEYLDKWFELDVSSPYMLLVANVKNSLCKEPTEEEKNLFGIDRLNINRSTIPAVTHVDYSARIQTVHRETNPYYYDLLREFYNLTGCPLVINTSFNVRGEPIVCTPEDAYKCFMGTDLDTLVIGNFILNKKDQPLDLIKSYKDKYELD
tara:strand:- start:1202 stop:3037 length:1836 start_codon:yes stop_codon:yes gene_type:complete